MEILLGTRNDGGGGNESDGGPEGGGKRPEDIQGITTRGRRTCGWKGGEREREIRGERRSRGRREGENRRLHKDRSRRVPGASLHTMHLC